MNDLIEPPTDVPPLPALDVIQKYNAHMRGNTTGPNCVDPNQCRGDCCSIMIDIPRVLAELYVSQEWLEPGQLRRGGPFAFRLGVSPETAKCVFFDPEVNGCRVHFTGFKPPQCWIYPVGFTSGVKTCKKGYDWDIIDPEKACVAENLLEDYKEFSLEEARHEVELLEASFAEKDQFLRNALVSLPPRKFVGFSWGYSGLEVADAGGNSLQLKSTCEVFVPDCPRDFIKCPHLCTPLVDTIIGRYAQNLGRYYQNEECLELVQFREVKAKKDVE
jgi:Fe-S-cluster containining protein